MHSSAKLHQLRIILTARKLKTLPEGKVCNSISWGFIYWVAWSLRFVFVVGLFDARIGVSTSAIGLYLGLLFKKAKIDREGVSVLFLASRWQAFPPHFSCALYFVLKCRLFARRKSCAPTACDIRIPIIITMIKNKTCLMRLFNPALFIIFMVLISFVFSWGKGAANNCADFTKSASKPTSVT